MVVTGTVANDTAVVGDLVENVVGSDVKPVGDCSPVVFNSCVAEVASELRVVNGSFDVVSTVKVVETSSVSFETTCGVPFVGTSESTVFSGSLTVVD